jgi:hypothetical protein
MTISLPPTEFYTGKMKFSRKRLAADAPDRAARDALELEKLWNQLNEVPRTEMPLSDFLRGCAYNLEMNV